MLIIKQDEGNFFLKKVNAFVYFYVNKTIRGKKNKDAKEGRGVSCSPGKTQ